MYKTETKEDETLVHPRSVTGPAVRVCSVIPFLGGKKDKFL